MKPNKGHSVIFKGYLRRFLPPVLINRGNRSYTVYRAILSDSPDTENNSALVVFVPRQFDMSAVERMVGQRVTAVLYFKLRINKPHYNTYINVIKLEPVAETMKHLTQQLKKGDTFEGTATDADGYATPYEY